jgi:hypothetical protein
MEKKTIGLFGGRGGLGEKLIPLLKINIMLLVHPQKWLILLILMMLNIF